MNSKIKILRFLLDNKESKFTIRRLSQETKINYRIVYEQVHRLEKEDLIKLERTGKAILCELTNFFNKDIYEAEYLRREDLFKNKELKLIRKRLSELDSLFVALLFGSYAKGKANKNSDIDILIIEGREDKIRSILSPWQEKIHLTFVSIESFIRMAKSKEFNVVNETIKNNIILIGIEEYYKILNNAR